MPKLVTNTLYAVAVMAGALSGAILAALLTVETAQTNAWIILLLTNLGIAAAALLTCYLNGDHAEPEEPSPANLFNPTGDRTRMLFSPNHNAAVTDLQFRLGRQFQLQLEVNKDQCLITSGFRYPSGDQIQILVRPDPQHSAGYIVDDRGEGAAELKDRLGYDSEEPLDGHLNHLFNQTCSRYDTTMDAANGEMETVRAKATWENLAAVVNQVLQATLLAAFINE